MKRVLLPLIAVGVLAACGSAANDSAGPADAPAATSEPAGSGPAVATTTGSPGPLAPTDSGLPADIPEALKFAAPLVGGGDIELTTLAGRPVLLWFWAPW